MLSSDAYITSLARLQVRGHDFRPLMTALSRLLPQFRLLEVFVFIVPSLKCGTQRI